METQNSAQQGSIVEWDFLDDWIYKSLVDEDPW